MKETLTAGGRCRMITVDVLVLGSGAAALNGAVRLRRLGVQDLVIVTEKLGSGTSANTGSDKQTYYRLHPAQRADSAPAMAEDLFAGGCMHGDTALVEAALSQQQFYHLVGLGVPFPHDRWGDYTGYITDHDAAGRGTSAGPETSILMYRALLQEVRRLGIPVMENLRVVELLTRPEGKGRRCRGMVALPADGQGPPVVFSTGALLMCTGGPGELYRDSVYPESQRGSAGMALSAGVRFQNLAESQFGLASTAVRWNLSGSYQQVLPRYFSTRPDGSGEEDFLAAFFPDARTMLRAQFLKGYQWPFDVRKVSGCGSSAVDLLVYFEHTLRGRRVFMDFRENPRYPGYTWNPAALPEEAAEYLERSSALADTPVKRLRAMNEGALRLYLEKGIDLASEPLEIAVCHQHMNGGIVPSPWWESSVGGLFAAGECAGTHGIYRPGGSALNAGQVGAFRAAECIARRHEPAESLVWDCPAPGGEGTECLDEAAAGVRRRMSENCAVFRSPENIARQLDENRRALEDLESSGGGSLDFYRLRDLLLTERAVSSSCLDLLRRLSGSRGSFIRGTADSFFKTAPGGACTGFADIEIDDSLNTFVQEAVMDGKGEVSVSYVPVRPIPRQAGWFEEVWRDFKTGRIFDE